jgi:RNA polymerase sigma factor (sigma-70 family)
VSGKLNIDEAAAIPPASTLGAWRFAPTLRGYFGRRVKGDVDDLVQEVLMRLEQRRAASEIENIEGYLFQVASSVLTDRLRRDRVRRRSAHCELTESHHPVEEISPARVLEGKERLKFALAALDEMAERPRQAFVLVRIEHMSYAAAAKTMGISVSAVEKHMMKVVRHLAERMRSLDGVGQAKQDGG